MRSKTPDGRSTTTKKKKNVRISSPPRSPPSEKKRSSLNPNDIAAANKGRRPSFVVEERDKIIDKLIRVYKHSRYRKDALTYNVPPQMHGKIVFRHVQDEYYVTSFINQTWVVAKRSFIHKLREPDATLTQAFNTILVPILFGSIFWQLDTTQNGADDRMNAISITVITLTYFAYDILLLFPQERAIFNREQCSGMYRPISFYLGKVISETPQHILFSFIQGAIAYWMFGLQNDSYKFAIWSLILVLLGLAGSGLLMIFSAFGKDETQSGLIATFFLFLFMLFDGNWISLDKIPSMWHWVQYISPLAYASQGCSVNEYRGLKLSCTQYEIAHDECYYQTGEELLETRGLDTVNIWWNIYMLIILNIAFRCFAFIGLWLLYRQQKPKKIIKDTFSCQRPSCCRKKYRIESEDDSNAHR